MLIMYIFKIFVNCLEFGFYSPSFYYPCQKSMTEVIYEPLYINVCLSGFLQVLFKTYDVPPVLIEVICSKFSVSCLTFYYYIYQHIG